MPFYANDPISFYSCLVEEGGGKGHSQNWPNNARHHPISFSSNTPAQSPSLLTESLKTRLIKYFITLLSFLKHEVIVHVLMKATYGKAYRVAFMKP